MASSSAFSCCVLGVGWGRGFSWSAHDDTGLRKAADSTFVGVTPEDDASDKGCRYWGEGSSPSLGSEHTPRNTKARKNSKAVTKTEQISYVRPLRAVLTRTGS